MKYYYSDFLKEIEITNKNNKDIVGIEIFIKNNKVFIKGMWDESRFSNLFLDKLFVFQVDYNKKKLKYGLTHTDQSSTILFTKMYRQVFIIEWDKIYIQLK